MKSVLFCLGATLALVIVGCGEKETQDQEFGPGNRVVESTAFHLFRFASGPHPVEHTSLAYIEVYDFDLHGKEDVSDSFPILVPGDYDPPDVGEVVMVQRALIHRPTDRIQLLTPYKEEE